MRISDNRMRALERARSQLGASRKYARSLHLARDPVSLDRFIIFTLPLLPPSLSLSIARAFAHRHRHIFFDFSLSAIIA